MYVARRLINPKGAPIWGPLIGKRAPVPKRRQKGKLLYPLKGFVIGHISPKGFGVKRIRPRGFGITALKPESFQTILESLAFGVAIRDPRNTPTNTSGTIIDIVAATATVGLEIQ